MYNPTEEEKNNCTCIVRDILRLENDFDCEKYVDDIFKTVYAIGGDYSKKTLRCVAETLYYKM